MGAYPAHNVTTELIQKYLDENKQLILAILDNQNLGKLNECAAYQAKLQANLMYLAAIADSQPPQPPVPAAQGYQGAAMQYMAQHQQAQQQAAEQQAAQQQATQQQAAQQQSFMAARNYLQYTQHSYPSLHQVQQQPPPQQQPMQAHRGMNSGGPSSINGLAPESVMAGNTPGFIDFGRGGNTGDGAAQASWLFDVVPKSNGLPAPEAGHGTSGGVGGGHGTQESETTYLKGSEEEGS